MSLHLIIDGYNLIKLAPALRLIGDQDLEAGRQALLHCLGVYRRSRPQHRITVVFDGWQAGDLRESRDNQRSMAIVFSRRGERADEVIKRLLAKEGQRAVVVSSDRELQDFADRVGAAWISAGQFALSHLREAASHDPGESEAPLSPRSRPKKGPAHRPPKRQRQRQQRLKKL
jgi:predicted RNA-binding protein with PIN domain